MGGVSRPSGLRLVFALVLLAFGVVELLRTAALVGAGGAYPLAVHLTFAVLALLAGGALWLRGSWAPAAIVALGVVIAATRLIDGLVLGIRPWLFALLGALVALVLALVLAAWARRELRLLP